MKKIISLVIFLIALIFAQAGNNGNVNLIFNNESIDLPVTSVSLVKANGLHLNFKAENNNSDVQQKITFEFGL